MKNDGLCAKVAFAIQNQRYLWNEAVWSQTYYTECLYRNSRAATIGDKSSDLGWTLAYFPGSKFFSTTDISHAFCQSATTFGDVGQFKLIPRTLWTLVRRSRDTRRRHASVLHWYTCKVVFRQFPHVAVADSFSVLSTHYVARGLGARFSVQVPSIARWSPRQHGLFVFNYSHYSFLARSSFTHENDQCLMYNSRSHVMFEVLNINCRIWMMSMLYFET